MTRSITLALLVVLGLPGQAQPSTQRLKLKQVYTSQLYVREAHNRNDGPEVEAYQRGGGGQPNSAWCSWFVSWCFRRSGVRTAYFGRARSWFDASHVVLNHGRQVPSQPTPQPGDVVGYEWGHPAVSHVGFLDLWGVAATCQTVEGNTGGGRQSRDGDGVYKNWRLKSQVAYVANVIDNPTYRRGE
ncbi:CHAP domain-containing protein [uncultured Hymenobacter sp.]|uniref:CHAP domain-containing protein n=1 Tax=uncultured Hymenobacter sp. TaxID=170016 RepID=UPI0035C9F5AE